MNMSLPACLQYPALFLFGRPVAARDGRSSQAACRRMTANQKQSSWPNLFAHMPASSLSHVSTYAPSFFPGLRANGFRREAWEA